MVAQINLGQFSLVPTPYGGWNLGLSQGANIFGFGGHRALGVSGNQGGVGISGTDNVIIANERVGLDSALGAGTNGVNLGSQLQFGNEPFPTHPGGQLGNFLDNIGSFFARLLPLSSQPTPDGAGVWNVPSSSRSHRLGTEGVDPDGFLPRPWETEDDVVPVDGDSNLLTTVFPTLLSSDSDESWDHTPTTEHDTATTPTEKPRQLPGMIDISAHHNNDP